jgi:cell division protein FtsN
VSAVASRDYKTPSRGARRSGSPLLVGVVIGLVLGLALALGVAIYLFKMPPPFVPARQAPVIDAMPPRPDPEPRTVYPGASRPGSVAEVSPTEPAEPAGKPQDYTFYGILAGKEQAVKAPETPAPAADKPAFSYFLQAGAFQNADDADNLKARLALAGVEAQIQTAQLPDGKTWHRVRLGPFHDSPTLNAAKETLAQNQIEFTLIKVQDRKVVP